MFNKYNILPSVERPALALALDPESKIYKKRAHYIELAFFRKYGKMSAENITEHAFDDLISQRDAWIRAAIKKHDRKKSNRVCGQIFKLIQKVGDELEKEENAEDVLSLLLDELQDILDENHFTHEGSHIK